MKYKIKSSVFSHVEYIPAKSKLVVDFNSGAIYEYLNVPHTILQELLKAESKGKYFNRNIRNNFKFIQKL